MDWQRGEVFRQRLDLAAIVASCSNRPALVAFLQRRRQDLHYAPHADPRSLSIFVTSSLIQVGRLNDTKSRLMKSAL